VHHAVDGAFLLAEGDILFFSGLLDRVQEAAAAHGLIPYDSSLELVHDPAIQAAFNTGAVRLPATSARALDAAGAETGPDLVQAVVKKGEGGGAECGGCPVAGKACLSAAS
jgi:hypothetical protein